MPLHVYEDDIPESESATVTFGNPLKTCRIMRYGVTVDRSASPVVVIDLKEDAGETLQITLSPTLAKEMAEHLLAAVR